MNVGSFIAEIANRRDAYGVVVARLIDWFSEAGHEPFELADYEAVMRDAGLMDEFNALSPMAAELIKD